jgi:glycosyltransferase involved in cell wall biosynthesis
MNSPVLSIIIPTRNRYKTAVACVKQVLSCEGDFELIVRDCSDSDSLKKALENFQDKRLRYDYSLPVSMTENWEGAISLARGDYICIIGDDDGINPITPKIAEYLKELDIQALIPSSSLIATYTWPDYPISKVAGKLTVKPCIGTLKKEVMTPSKLEQFVRTNGAGYQQLPRLYYCLIARRVVEALKKLTGRVFDSTSPDVYSAYALTSVLKEYYVVDYPLVIGGSSRLSNSGRIQVSKTEVQKHLEEFSEYQFPILVPPLLTIRIALAEAMIKALENTLRHDLLKWLQIEKLYALTIGHHPAHWRMVISHLHDKVLVDKNIIYKSKVYAGIILHLARATVTKMIRPLSNLLPKNEEVTTYNTHDINEASAILVKHLHDSGLTERVMDAFEKHCQSS